MRCEEGVYIGQVDEGRALDLRKSEPDDDDGLELVVERDPAGEDVCVWRKVVRTLFRRCAISGMILHSEGLVFYRDCVSEEDGETSDYVCGPTS